MNSLILDIFPLWILIPLLVAVMAGALEGGYRAGRWRHDSAPDEQQQPVGAIVASILGLLALVLGFTFGFAASRFEARRTAVLEESNAIGTTYLRTRFLPKDLRDPAAKALREYVDVRLQGVEGGDLMAAIKRSEELHLELWSQATQAADNDSESEVLPLYIASLNQLIDLHAVRVQAGIRNRIPSILWFSILSVSVLSMAAVGYQAGLSATRRSPAMPMMVLAFMIVLALIIDLDRSKAGLLEVSQQALIDVQNMMKTPLP